MIKRIGLTCIFSAILSLCLLTTGCEDDNDSPAAETPTGTSLVRGNVNSVSDALPAASARNGTSGITVQLVGPVTLETTTDGSGVFQFTNVPAGEYKIILIVNGREHELAITVGEAEEVIIREIKIDGSGNITASAVYAQDPEDEDEPINIAGDWTFALALPAIAAPGHMIIIQDGNSLSGTLDNTHTFTGTLEGNTVNFTFTLLPGRMPILVSATGTVNGEATSMSGTALMDTGEQKTWTATAGFVAPI